MRDTRRGLEEKRREGARKLDALRMQIRAGAEDLARDDFTEVDDAGLDALLADLGRPARGRS